LGLAVAGAQTAMKSIIKNLFLVELLMLFILTLAKNVSKIIIFCVA